jgi:hypothetical protein
MRFGPEALAEGQDSTQRCLDRIQSRFVAPFTFLEHAKRFGRTDRVSSTNRAYFFLVGEKAPIGRARIRSDKRSNKEEQGSERASWQPQRLLICIC